MIDASVVKGRHMLSDPTLWLQSPLSCQLVVKHMMWPPGLDQDQKVCTADFTHSGLGVCYAAVSSLCLSLPSG